MLYLIHREQEYRPINPDKTWARDEIGVGIICREGKMNLLVFGIGLVVGTLLGVLFISLCLAARTGDIKMRSPKPVNLHEGRYQYDRGAGLENERKSRNVMPPKDASLIYGQQ